MKIKAETMIYDQKSYLYPPAYDNLEQVVKQIMADNIKNIKAKYGENIEILKTDYQIVDNPRAIGKNLLKKK